MVGLSRSIIMQFMVVGHTKFTPDSCFGLVKQRYWRTHVECLSDIVDVLNKSGYINHARLVGTQEGQVLVPTYDWQTYLSPNFKKIPNIKRFDMSYTINKFSASSNNLSCYIIISTSISKSPSSSISAPPNKRLRQCGKCGRSGHNLRLCRLVEEN